MKSRERGLSLIELVVAMALFSLVAVLGMQTLNVTLKGRDALSVHDDRARELGVALALLRSDLERAAPVLFYQLGSAPLSALSSDGPGQFSMSVFAFPTVDGTQSPPFERVWWRLETRSGQLFRRGSTAGAAVVERPILSGVQSLRIRSFHKEQGWVAGIGRGLAQDIPGIADGDMTFARVANRFTDSLPMALEVTLAVDGIGEIPVLEVLP